MYATGVSNEIEIVCMKSMNNENLHCNFTRYKQLYCREPFATMNLTNSQTEMNSHLAGISYTILLWFFSSLKMTKVTLQGEKYLIFNTVLYPTWKKVPSYQLCAFFLLLT